MIITERNPGSMPDDYITKLDTETRATSCDCRGWTRKKEGKPRECRHTKEILLKYPNGVSSPAVIEPPSVKVKGEIKPMLASAMTSPDTLPTEVRMQKYCNAEWILEPKYDGHRLLVRKTGQSVTGWSRPRGGGEALRKTLPPHLIKALQKLPTDCLVDGEAWIAGGHSYDVTVIENQTQLMFMMFDVVELFGVVTTAKPYYERRELLETVLQHYEKQDDAGWIQIPPVVPVSFAAVERIWAHGGEGAILKRIASTYQPRRSPDWVKVKKHFAKALIITGFETGKSAYSKTLLRDDEGNTTSCKTINPKMQRAIEANPDAFINRRLVISFTERTPAGKYQNVTWDHFAGAGEGE